MRQFKFFEKQVKGTLNTIEGENYATASFNDDTPEGHMGRRRLYHTNQEEYSRLRQSNNEMELYFYERGFRNVDINFDEQRQEELTRRINGGDRTFFSPTSVTKVNPKWWMKIKIVLQESWYYNPIGIIVAATLFTLVTIIGIAKLLGA
jgi:hypothetical protein